MLITPHLGGGKIDKWCCNLLVVVKMRWRKKHIKEQESVQARSVLNLDAICTRWEENLNARRACIALKEQESTSLEQGYKIAVESAYATLCKFVTELEEKPVVKDYIKTTHTGSIRLITFAYDKYSPQFYYGLRIDENHNLTPYLGSWKGGVDPVDIEKAEDMVGYFKASRQIIKILEVLTYENLLLGLDRRPDGIWRGIQK